MGKTNDSSSRKLGPGALVLRVFLLVALGCLVIVAVKEIGPRWQAAGSHKAVSDRLAKEGETNPLRKSQIKTLIQGSPEVESVDPKSLNSPLLATAERYTWQGLIRSYSLTIGYSLGDDPEVEVVDAK